VVKPDVFNRKYLIRNQLIEMLEVVFEGKKYEKTINFDDTVLSGFEILPNMFYVIAEGVFKFYFSMYLKETG
jgi:hypothetical protein